MKRGIQSMTFSIFINSFFYPRFRLTIKAFDIPVVVIVTSY